MRLRNIRGSKEEIENDVFVIKDPDKYKGKWDEVFKNNNPIHIEIGMGKGQFILNKANNNPDINYIGIEKYSSVLYRALQRRKDFCREKSIDLSNIRFLRFDAEEIISIFGENDVARIYLNFSDPWPKERHAKRRLTSDEFLDKYDKVLKKNGEIIFKTDNRRLFDFSVESINESKWNIKEITYDLHNSEYIKGNIVTEYEERFVMEGIPICRLVTNRE
ncbi:MAG TPA: tRNA (guanosine(46)-N7)-methyltransferase TrmB [Clostridiales bacterium]|nr:tRNA (guanosine(46)-N7)-methyltransferase TrmB [Clostridiales bacterium]